MLVENGFVGERLNHFHCKMDLFRQAIGIVITVAQGFDNPERDLAFEFHEFVVHRLIGRGQRIKRLVNFFVFFVRFDGFVDNLGNESFKGNRSGERFKLGKNGALDVFDVDIENF